MKTYYSVFNDVELWTETDINVVIIECLDGFLVLPDDNIIEIYSGDLKVNKPHFYLPQIVEQILDNAESEHGECSEIEHWMDKGSLLQKDFEQWFDQWCKDNDEMPDFGYITNIKMIKVLVTNFDVYDYEIIK